MMKRLLHICCEAMVKYRTLEMQDNLVANKMAACFKAIDSAERRKTDMETSKPSCVQVDQGDAKRQKKESWTAVGIV